MKVRQTTTCHTCRARKLGCDGKLPVCSQCVFSRRECAGYQHDLIFIQHQSTPTVPPPSKDVRNSLGNSKATPTLAIIPPSVPTKRSPLETTSALIISRYAPWLLYTSGYSNIAIPPFRICGSWVGVLPKLLDEGAPSSILPSAVITLGLSIRCKDALHGPPTSSFAKAHCLALRLLRKSLIRVDSHFETETVAASMCLSLAENMLPTSKEGSMAHLNGVGKLLQLSGPGKYSSGVSYQLFIGIRPLIIFGAFESRRSCFLAEERWQTIPFLVYPALPLQSLLNHAALIPSLLENFDNLIGYPLNSGLLVAHEIWIKFGEVFELLNQWERSYRLEIKERPYWPRISQNTSQYSVQVESQESFWFLSMFVANAFTHLWALRIICMIHCEQLKIKFPDLISEGLSIEFDRLVGNPEHSVCELSTWICKSMDYLMQEDGRLYGPVSTLFPLRVAYNIFRSDSLRNKEQLDWCQKIVDRLVFKGVDLSSLL